MILSNSTKKAYSALATVKGRRDSGMFMAQGTKCVLDTIDHFEVVTVVATDAWLKAHRHIAELCDTTPANAADMQRISTLSTAPDAIAILRIPEAVRPSIKGKLALALDGIQDPGNLGTIVRLADWMGITDIIASTDTVDVYNPKVVQATMGAISRVSVYYTDLPQYIKSLKDTPVYGTYLNGDNIYKAKLSENGLIVMGNEGNGIRAEVERLISHRLFIPPYPEGRHTSESLNVAIATAITLSEFRRRI